MDAHKIDEISLIKYLLEKNQIGHFMQFMVEGAYPFPIYDDRIVNFKIVLNVLREDLGLQSEKKPGDIDILVIPQYKGVVDYAKAMAIEVKVVRPTLKKPGKSPSSLGYKQVLGLKNDGFPFCGLLHISATEALPEKAKIDIPVMHNKFDSENNLVPTGRTIKLDHFGLSSVERQMGRLDNMKLPESVGVCTKAINFFYVEEKKMIGITERYSKPPKLNEQLCEKLVNNIRSHYLNNTEMYSG